MRVYGIELISGYLIGYTLGLGIHNFRVYIFSPLKSWQTLLFSDFTFDATGF
jgi:hypothetical protein